MWLTRCCWPSTSPKPLRVRSTTAVTSNQFTFAQWVRLICDAMDHRMEVVGVPADVAFSTVDLLSLQSAPLHQLLDLHADSIGVGLPRSGSCPRRNPRGCPLVSRQPAGRHNSAAKIERWRSTTQLRTNRSRSTGSSTNVSARSTTFPTTSTTPTHIPANQASPATTGDAERSRETAPGPACRSSIPVSLRTNRVGDRSTTTSPRCRRRLGRWRVASRALRCASTSPSRLAALEVTVQAPDVVGVL